MKKFLNFIILSSVALLFNGCISGWGGLYHITCNQVIISLKKCVS